MAGPLASGVLRIRERPPSTLKNVDGGPHCRCYRRIWECPPSTLENVNSGPPGGAAGDPVAPTINIKKCRQWAPWWVLSEGSGVPTINVKKHRRWTPGGCYRRVQEHLPSTLKTLMASPLAGAVGHLGPCTINVKKCQ
jgi:hypothetical protein